MALLIPNELRNTIGDTLFFGFAMPDYEGKNVLGILYGRNTLFPLERFLPAIKMH
jgi:hypothetical protein